MEPSRNLHEREKPRYANRIHPEERMGDHFNPGNKIRQTGRHMDGQRRKVGSDNPFPQSRNRFLGSALDQWIRGNQKNPMQIFPKQGDKKPKSRNVPIAPYPFSPRTWLDIETLAEAKRVESVPPAWVVKAKQQRGQMG